MPQVGNRLLDSLTGTSRAQVLAASHYRDLPFGTSLYRAHETPTEAHFLNAGIASLVLTLSPHNCVEVGMIADEGVVGTSSLLGIGPVLCDCSMQGNGSGYCLPLEALGNLFRNTEDLRLRMLESFQVQTVATVCLSACNKLHETRPRLARWLLMVQDRLRTDTFFVTQETLADTLGTRRMTVTDAAGSLQRAGLIEYRRGIVRILDPTALQASACACYGRQQALYRDLYRAPLS